MTAKYFPVAFNDLSFDKQQDMIKEIKQDLLKEYQNETEYAIFVTNFGKKEYKDMAWQEAFIREYSIDYMLWETEEEAKKFDWGLAVDLYAEESAEEGCVKSMNNNRIEIEI